MREHAGLEIALEDPFPRPYGLRRKSIEQPNPQSHDAKRTSRERNCFRGGFGGSQD